MLQIRNGSPFATGIALLPDADGIDTLYLVVKGTFTLEAVDVRTRRVAWRATAPDVIKPGPSAEQVPPAVRQMMESVPHRP